MFWAVNHITNNTLNNNQYACTPTPMRIASSEPLALSLSVLSW